jgi:hypothetical protein
MKVVLFPHTNSCSLANGGTGVSQIVRCVPVKNAFGLYAVVFCACELILSFSVAF